MSQPGWSEIEATVNRIFADYQSSFDPQTMENTRLLLQFVSDRYRPANDCGKGYWDTICLSWWSATYSIAIEIFEDRYEFYRFSEQSTQIGHFDQHASGVPHPLVALLDGLLLANGGA